MCRFSWTRLAQCVLNAADKSMLRSQPTSDGFKKWRLPEIRSFWRNAGITIEQIIAAIVDAFVSPTLDSPTAYTSRTRTVPPEAAFALVGPYYASRCLGLWRGREELFLHMLTLSFACAQVNPRTRSPHENDQDPLNSETVAKIGAGKFRSSCGTRPLKAPNGGTFECLASSRPIGR